MATAHKNIHLCDDWLSAEISDLDKIHSLGDKMRTDGSWMEVVGGLQSIAVQFDPARLKPSQALILFEEQLASCSPVAVQTASEIQLPVCYHPDFGLDCEWIAERLGIKPDNIAEWHSGLKFTVAMLGFMPGFGYLQTDSIIAEIGRLPHPRQKIDAGSIGIIGNQSCIYSFDSPGGWPIIGRTAVRLFDEKNTVPNILRPGQTVRFIQVTKAEFENIV